MTKTLIICAIALTVTFAHFAQTKPRDEQTWTSTFQLARDELTSTGRNPYFILEPGYTLVLEKGSERLTITVQNIMS